MQLVAPPFSDALRGELRPLVQGFLQATDQADADLDGQLHFLERKAGCPLAFVVVARDADGRVRGFLCATLTQRSFEWTLFIDRIYATKANAGRRLFAWAEARARDLGATRIWGISMGNFRGIARLFQAQPVGVVVEKPL